MAVYATTGDVEIELGRALTTAQAARATVLLSTASKLIDIQVPTVAARLAAGGLDPAILTMVVVSMVTRALRSTGGVKSETIGPKSVVYDTSIEPGLYLTAADLAFLTPVPATPATGARSIRLARTDWWCR